MLYWNDSDQIGAQDGNHDNIAGGYYGNTGHSDQIGKLTALYYLTVVMVARAKLDTGTIGYTLVHTEGLVIWN